MPGDSVKNRTYEAIVIGSGASGGWAAKEFCDKGLKTLVLERGREVKHGKDYPTASKAPWEFEYRGTVPIEKRKDYQGARFLREETLHWALKDDEQPFIQEKPFRWVRGYHVGGKSLLWARQTQRWSDFDFEGPKRDGLLLTGRSGIRILSHGTAMLKNLQALQVTKMAYLNCPIVK